MSRKAMLNFIFLVLKMKQYGRVTTKNKGASHWLAAFQKPEGSKNHKSTSNEMGARIA